VIQLPSIRAKGWQKLLARFARWPPGALALAFNVFPTQRDFRTSNLRPCQKSEIK
jgi:hypothetical protein